MVYSTLKVVSCVSSSEQSDFRNVNLTWKNVSYTTKNKNTSCLKDILSGHRDEYIQLLHNVSGIAKSGSFIALLGPSGAGKTTFLAAISRRVKGNVTGDVFLNGEHADREIMTKMSAFIPQEDLAIDSLTIQQHMQFMGSMKMDRRIKAMERKQRIQSLLHDLGLAKCSDTKLSNLSGGERKKVTLAAQLLTEPGILFCDEPTTGLDSFGATSIIRTLREISKTGRIVICSIHQPASGMLDFFNQVILLSTGKIAFQGSIANAFAFFQSLGLRCPVTFNKAEFYITQLSIRRDEEKSSHEKIQWICNEFAASKYGTKISETIEKTVISSSTKSNNLWHGEFQKICFFSQLNWLLWRIYVDSKRKSTFCWMNFLLYMVIATILSVPYVNVTKNPNQNSVQNVQGLMYLVVTETIFTFNYAVFNTFPKELPLLLRDIGNGLYDPAPYYISKVIFSIPGAVVKAFSYTLLIFIVVGLQGGISGFVMFAIPVILCALSSSAIGHFMSATFESVSSASLLSVPIDYLTLIYSGLFLHLGDSSAPLFWLKYLSQFYYGTEAVSLMQWKHVEKIDCSSDSRESCLSNGLQVLDKYGYGPDNYFFDCLGLITIFAVAHSLGFVLLRIRSRKQAVY